VLSADSLETALTGEDLDAILNELDADSMLTRSHLVDCLNQYNV
jgi:hypothetical protein